DELPLAMNRAAARRIPFARGELEVVAAVERVDGLYEPLAERRRAEDERAIVILERAGDDLGGRRRAAVEEHDERNLAIEMPALRAFDRGRTHARAHAQDFLAGLEEQARSLERLVDDAAAVVAHVEHEA